MNSSKRTTITDALILISTVGRLLNAYGILASGSRADDVNFGRPIGAVSTYLSTIGLAVSIGLDALSTSKF